MLMKDKDHIVYLKILIGDDMGNTKLLVLASHFRTIEVKKLHSEFNYKV